MSIPYEEIEKIARETRASVIMAGHDIRLCVWEFSPSIWFAICRWHSENFPSIPASSPGPYLGTYMGIPVRDGVTDEATGILLKMVNLNPAE